MQNRIPWYYIWSEKYELFHTIFQDIANIVYPNIRKEFQIRPIYLEQNEFSKKLSKDIKVHPFAGCNIKIDALINCIEANIGHHFLFTDIDIIIRQPDIKEMVNPFLSHDMAFMTEETNMKLANIGFCFIKATEDTLRFWKNIQKLVKETGGHDQTIVNETLHYSNLKIGFFSDKHIISQKTCAADAQDFKVVQILSSGGNSSYWQYIEKLYTLPIFINLGQYQYLISDQEKHDIQKFTFLVNNSPNKQPTKSPPN